LKRFGFGYPTIEICRKVVIDVIYLIILPELAPSPHVWMVLIQPLLVSCMSTI
jgi:hypothetical protein